MSSQKNQTIVEGSVVTVTIEQTKRGSSELTALCSYIVIDEMGTVLYRGTEDSTFCPFKQKQNCYIQS